ncbi:MAG: hypothetical protein AAF591_17425 [Verrucomicrobiota bacterium]
MPDVAPWERKFVERYVEQSKVDRYLMKLKGRKHRREILDRLNHSLDYRSELATSIPSSERSPQRLLNLLRAERIDDTCHVLADGNENDGRELRIERAVEEIFGNAFGMVLICPPIPIALYKEEDIGDMLILKPKRA